MKVRKRDGSIVPYNSMKITKAIEAAFTATKESYDKELLDKFISSIPTALKLDDDKIVDIETIQNMVEQWLMTNSYLKTAKAYIIYREEHRRHRIQAQDDVAFIKNFVQASNTANATIDDNSNVNGRNVAVLNAEIHKAVNKNTNMYIWENEVKKRYPDIDVKQMRKDFTTIMYPHDSSSMILAPYCMAVTMYPMLLDGLEKLGGKSTVPKSLESFCGIYINLVFALASEVKGAVATPEFLMYFSYFAEKEWGKYLEQACEEDPRILHKIHQYFQQVTYSINQVASSRGAQCPFTNFSFFDMYFFEGMFGDFMFPDGTRPEWSNVNFIQREYLHWLNQERLRCVLTFPVCSYACLVEDGKFKDQDTFHFLCKEYAEGNSFFTYLSESVDSLSSCCRLQNAVTNNSFNFTNGQLGVQTGSKNVITLNLNRIIQDWIISISNKDSNIANTSEVLYDSNIGFKPYLINILERVYKYHTAYNSLLHWAEANHLYTSYDAGFINMNKQYLTIGINGLNQAAEILGIQCNKNEHYQKFCRFIFGIIKDSNTKHKTKTETFNTEQTPCESAAIKLYNRDKEDGYWVPEDTNLYASYVFKPNDPNISVFDKLYLHSSAFAADKLDGGSAAHIGLAEHLSEKQYEKVLEYAAKVGCKYFTFNVPNCECEDCHYIAKQPFKQCPKCNSTNVSLWDRIIGYLTKIKNWSAGRQIEQKTRVYGTI